jgi:four helix bundle protein
MGVSLISDFTITLGVKPMSIDSNRRRIVRKHTDLDVYQKAFSAAMQIFEASKSFPREEQYSLTDQVRRSSRSVSANIAEAWRKRRYEGSFISKLSDADAEAAETQVWIQYAVACQYLDRKTAAELYKEYDAILGMLVQMMNSADKWVLAK